jgi:hypothetical protein
MPAIPRVELRLTASESVRGSVVGVIEGSSAAALRAVTTGHREQA